MDDREKLSESGGNGAAGKGPSGSSKAFKAASFAIMAVLIVALILSLVFLFVHRHELTHFSSAEATCTVGGNSEYWYCAGCGKYFEDKDGKHEIKEDEALIAAAGHVWVAASCEAPRQCSVCGYSDGEALGHEFKTYISNGDASCASDGTETAVCSRCDATDTRIIKGSALGHDLVQSKEVKAPTCTHDGELEYVCADCGHTETAVIPATGVHDWDVINITVPENCKEIVKLEYVCADCGKSFDVTISLNGEHRYDFENGKVKVAAVCNKGGIIEYACLDCGMTVEVLTPASGVHRWDDGVLSVPADCEGEGEMLFTCLDCGAVKTKAVAATGVHDWDFENGAVTPATETSEGKIVYSCKDCEETLEITFPASEGHDYGKPVITAPDCTTAGSVVFTCTGCGDTVSAAIPATGAHDWGNGIVTLPTCESEGEIVYTCTACGAQKTQDLPIAEHVWIEATCTAPKTCAVCGATEGDALSHDWSAYVIYDDIHLRECNREGCGGIEYAEHSYGENNECVCGKTNGTQIDVQIDYIYGYQSSFFTQTTSESGNSSDLFVSAAATVDLDLIMPGGFQSVDVTLTSQTALVDDVRLDLSVTDSEGNAPVANYMKFTSDYYDDTITFYPMRFYIGIWDDEIGTCSLVKFCEGCERCNDHDHSSDPTALYNPNANYVDYYFKCNTCENCYLRNIDELVEILKSENSPLNKTFKAGEKVNFKFRIGWNWAFDINWDYSTNTSYISLDKNPEVFEVRSDNGRYYFTNTLTANIIGGIDELSGSPTHEDYIERAERNDYSDIYGQKWKVVYHDEPSLDDYQLDIVSIQYNISFSSVS